MASLHKKNARFPVIITNKVGIRTHYLNIKFFNLLVFCRIPSNTAQREKWMRTLNRPDWTPSKNSTICSKHFEDKCFIQRKDRRVLMKDSIPTLFVPVSMMY